MDAYYVLDLPDNLESLEKDMQGWLSLPRNIQLVSDDVCRQRYGMNNRSMYEYLKNILQGNLPSSLEYTSEGTITFKDDEASTLKSLERKEKTETEDNPDAPNFYKVTQAKKLMDANPNIFIICDFIDDKECDYGMDTLNYIYNRYINSNSEHRRQSDSYSMLLWGTDVHSMYHHMRSKIQNTIDDTVETPEGTDNQFLDGIYRDKTNIEQLDKQIYYRLSDNELEDPIKEAVIDGGAKIVIKDKGSFRPDNEEILPFLTYSQYVNCARSLNMKKILSDPFTYIYNFKHTVKDDAGKLIDMQNRGYNEGLLEIGWNPYVKVSRESIKEAREKQIEWFNRRYPFVEVDISNKTVSSSIEHLREVNDKYDDNKMLKPIFIITREEKVPNPILGKRLMQPKYYNPGIALNSSLAKIYTFGDMHDPDSLNIVDLKYYQSMVDGVSKNINVSAFYVNPDTYDKIKDGLDYVFKNQRNAIAKVSDRFSADSPDSSYNLSFINADMINLCFSIGKTGIVKKNGIFRSKYNIYSIYKGKAARYSSKDAEKKVLYLMSIKKYSDLIYLESFSNNLEMYSCISKDPDIDHILREARDLLDPVAVEAEVLDNYEDLKLKYDGNTKLLSAYGFNDINGIVRALERISDVAIACKKKMDELDKAHPDYSGYERLYTDSVSVVDLYKKRLLDPSKKKGFDLHLRNFLKETYDFIQIDRYSNGDNVSKFLEYRSSIE